MVEFLLFELKLALRLLIVNSVAQDRVHRLPQKPDGGHEHGDGYAVN